MPIEFQKTNKPLPDNALIVCAGTMTCSKVEDMGSGFNTFKETFKDNTHYMDLDGGWKTALQEILDNQKIKPVPAYIRIAKQGNLIGGIATVPVKSDLAIQNDQYKNAVKLAIKDALHLKRPLYIQPLGIGVYGWPPELAAKLFYEAIEEADPNDNLNMFIPLYHSEKDSKDQRFKTEFLRLWVVAMTAPLVSITEEQSQLSILTDTRLKLLTIVEIVIGNIELKRNNRYTSGKDSEKISQLKLIRDELINNEDLVDYSNEMTKISTIRKIIETCHIKRHSIIHFWQTPDSVFEVKKLLEIANLPADLPVIAPNNR